MHAFLLSLAHSSNISNKNKGLNKENHVSIKKYKCKRTNNDRTDSNNLFNSKIANKVQKSIYTKYE